MTFDRKVLGYFAGTTILTLAASVPYLVETGAADEDFLMLLRLTARISFVVLLVIFVARPLRQMFHTPFTKLLLTNRPFLGATFAGMHTAHLALLIYRAQQVPDFELSILANVLGSLTYVVIYAMLITTFSGPRRAIGPKAWRKLHKTGLYVLTIAFIQTQLPRSLDDLSGMNWWLLVLIIVALVIRLTAYLAKHNARS